jgi:hypothetical protein
MKNIEWGVYIFQQLRRAYTSAVVLVMGISDLMFR